MAGLPLELWSRALSYVPTASLLCCASVCRNWHALVQMELVQNINYVESLGNAEALEYLVRLLKNHPRLAASTRRIAISTDMTANVIRLLQCYPSQNRIKSLSLHLFKGHGYDHIISSQYHEVMPLQALRFLSIIDERSQNSLIATILSQSPHLRQLELRSISPNPVKIPQQYLAHLHYLEHVRFDNVDGGTILNIISCSARSLAILDMYDCTMDTAVLDTMPSFPALRGIHTEEDCTPFVALTPMVRSISITENHWPLHYIHDYHTACQHITSMNIKDNPYSEFVDIRAELQTIFQHKLLPQLQYLEVGTWETLKMLVPFMPPAVRRIDLHELEASTCHSIFLSASQNFPSPPRQSITHSIYVDDEASEQHETVQSSLRALKLPSWFGAMVLWNQKLIWKWETESVINLGMPERVAEDGSICSDK